MKYALNLISILHLGKSNPNGFISSDVLLLVAFYKFPCTSILLHINIKVNQNISAFLHYKMKLNHFLFLQYSLQKSKCWEYEQESRLISINEGTINDNIETSGIVKEVIIGCNVKDDEVKSIKEYVTSANSEIQIYQMKKDSKAFKLNKVLIK